jgi:uncharacterized membrane protein YfcA
MQSAENRVVSEVFLFAVSVIAGAIASVAGFGIGSILTPILSLEAGTSLAVKAISVPHFVGTLLRFSLIRSRVNRRVLLHFGILSAAGGLAGALLQRAAGNPVLTLVFAILLIFAGAVNLTGYASKLRFGRRSAWFAGALSGLLGGLVGNQGGIRSAALLGFNLDRNEFVTTATAIGLIVDAARMPVYFAAAGYQLTSMIRPIVIATAGVVTGTLLGMRVLRRMPEHWFRRIVGALVLALGVFTLFRF